MNLSPNTYSVFSNRLNKGKTAQTNIFTNIKNNNSHKTDNSSNKKRDKKPDYLKIGGILTIGLGALFVGYKVIPALLKNVGKNPINTKPLVEQFPELKSSFDEIRILSIKTNEKYKKNILDIDYWKDIFRVETIFPAENLKILRETNNPALKTALDKEKNYLFRINEGIMIHGSDRPEKKELVDHFIKKAKEAEFDIIHIPSEGFKVLKTPYGEFNPSNADDKFTQVSQAINNLYPKAKEKFKNEKKATMFVMDNVDDLLNVKNPKLKAANSSLRGAWNKHTHESGKDGIITITTAKNPGLLDESCTRTGRIAYQINIDDAVKH